jgi:hypothetical protein
MDMPFLNNTNSRLAPPLGANRQETAMTRIVHATPASKTGNPAESANDPAISETLWVTLKIPVNQPAQLQVLHFSDTRQRPDLRPVHASLLSREQTRVFLNLMNQLGQRPDTRLETSTHPDPAIEQQLQRLASTSHGQEENPQTTTTLTGRVVEICPDWQLTRMQIPGGELWLSGEGYVIGDQVPVQIRARDVSLSLTPHTDTSFLNVLPAIVNRIEESPRAGMCDLTLRLGHSNNSGCLIPARVSRRSVKQLWLTPGLKLWVQIKSAALAI